MILYFKQGMLETTALRQWGNEDGSFCLVTPIARVFYKKFEMGKLLPKVQLWAATPDQYLPLMNFFPLSLGVDTIHLDCWEGPSSKLLDLLPGLLWIKVSRTRWKSDPFFLMGDLAVVSLVGSLFSTFPPEKKRFSYWNFTLSALSSVF